MDDNPEARPRKKAVRAPARKKTPAKKPKRTHGQEAVMTLVSIMKDDSDPRVQIAAARALLSRSASAPEETVPLPELSADDIDEAIAAAKALLDELAARKAGGVPGAGGVAVAGKAVADNAAG